MVRGRVRKADGTYLIDIRLEDAQRMGLRDGMEVIVSFEPVESRAQSISDEEFDSIVLRIIDEHREALEYLVERE